MLMHATCNQCHERGSFDIELTFYPKGRACCGHCGQVEQKSWLFHFCNLECLFGWMKKNKVAEKGVPCRDCFDHETGKPSGFMAGFKINGTCRTCGGEKAVKGSMNQKTVASIR